MYQKYQKRQNSDSRYREGFCSEEIRPSVFQKSHISIVYSSKLEAIEKIYAAGNTTIVIDSDGEGVLSELARELLEQPRKEGGK